MARSHRGRAEGVRQTGEELRSAAEPGKPVHLPMPDRTVVAGRLTATLATAQHSTAVLLVDLDHFRMINASFGHHVGDQLLVAVGARLRAAVSGRETVARFGDAEFVVICAETDDHSAYALACFLRNVLAEPFRLDGAAVAVTASIGVASAPAGAAVAAADLLRRADTAVNAGKTSGRGRVHLHEQAPDDPEADHYALAAELPAALAGEQLHLEYQPLVDLRSGSVVGMEALARWTHPEFGPVSPSSFVAAAELTGVASELDRWVAQRALRDIALLRRAGVVPADAHLAVNVSTSNLSDDVLFRDLLGWAERWGVPADQLVLEITETAIMQDTECAAELLHLLREQGVRVAMDDFGTGYSSLAHLRDLPISALKIDRSFVVDITGHRDALEIVAWIVELARALEVDVVAEGVETPEQAALLRELGCVTAQGWLWGPAASVPALLSGGPWTSPLLPGHGVPVRPRTTRRGHRDGTDAHGVDRLLALHRAGASIDAIAAALDAEGFRTPAGRRWLPSGVARLISQRIRRQAGKTDDQVPAARQSASRGRA